MITATFDISPSAFAVTPNYTSPLANRLASEQLVCM